MSNAPCNMNCNMNCHMNPGMNRNMNQHMHASKIPEYTCSLPVSSRKSLLDYINEVSFAVYETLLFLDTHPMDQEALAFLRTHNQLRETAMKEYAKRYGPLTINTTDDCSSQCWEWINQPWPWEGGDC